MGRVAIGTGEGMVSNCLSTVWIQSDGKRKKEEPCQFLQDGNSQQKVLFLMTFRLWLRYPLRVELVTTKPAHHHSLHQLLALRRPFIGLCGHVGWCSWGPPLGTKMIAGLHEHKQISKCMSRMHQPSCKCMKLYHSLHLKQVHLNYITQKDLSERIIGI